MNKHIESALSALLTPSQLSTIYRSPLGSNAFGADIQELVRRSFIPAFTEDMRICTYISVIALGASVATWQRNPPSGLRGHDGGNDHNVPKKENGKDSAAGVLEA
jgi:hypothetical protein